MFNQNIKALRLEMGLTQGNFARFLNRTQSTISDWETGRSEPNLDDLKQIAIKCDVNLNYLLGLTDDWGNVTLSAGAISSNNNTVNSHNTINSAAPTTPDEAELLSLWRTATKEKKNAILQLLK